MTGARPLSVLLAGGGSAGHVNPLLATADALRRRMPESRLTVLGTPEGLEAELVSARGYELRTIDKVPFPRRPGKAALAFPGRLRAVTREVQRLIADVEADVVVGFGGYVAAPAYLAARRAGVPVVIHEQNARPGFANRLGARFTRHVAVTFPGTRLPHSRVIGLPLREEVADLDRSAKRAEGLEHFGLVDGSPTLLVFGGSLGALHLNEAFAGAAADLTAAGVQVLHLTGAGKELQIDSDPAVPYRTLAYTDRMDLAYSVADLAVCRAGAGTVCELTAVGLPAIYVPLPIGNGEQRLNAAPVVAAGGGLLVDDAQVTPDWVRTEVIPLVTDRPRLELMAREAAVMGHREADETLADMVIRAASGEPPPGPGEVTGPPDPLDPGAS